MWYHTGASVLKAFAANQSFAISMKDSVQPPLSSLKAGTPAAVFSAAEETDRWLFNADTDQFVMWQTPLGSSFSQVGWGLELTFAMTTATSGNVVWGAQVMASNQGAA